MLNSYLEMANTCQKTKRYGQLGIVMENMYQCNKKKDSNSLKQIEFFFLYGFKGNIENTHIFKITCLGEALKLYVVYNTILTVISLALYTATINTQYNPGYSSVQLASRIFFN